MLSNEPTRHWKMATFQTYLNMRYIRKLYTRTHLPTKQEDITIATCYNENNVYKFIAYSGLEIAASLMNFKTVPEYRCGATFTYTRF